MKLGLAQIIGKEVTGAIVATNTRSPERQLFLMFSDGTYFEVWGSNFSCAGSAREGGPEDVINYIVKAGGEVAFTYDGARD